MLLMSIIMITQIVFIVSFVLGGGLVGWWCFDPKRAAEHALGADSL
jgi:flagellar basal body-associated protein FliL